MSMSPPLPPLLPEAKESVALLPSPICSPISPAAVVSDETVLTASISVPEMSTDCEETSKSFPPKIDRTLFAPPWAWKEPASPVDRRMSSADIDIDEEVRPTDPSVPALTRTEPVDAVDASFTWPLTTFTEPLIPLLMDTTPPAICTLPPLALTLSPAATCTLPPLLSMPSPLRTDTLPPAAPSPPWMFTEPPLPSEEGDELPSTTTAAECSTDALWPGPTEMSPAIAALPETSDILPLSSATDPLEILISPLVEPLCFVRTETPMLPPETDTRPLSPVLTDVVPLLPEAATRFPPENPDPAKTDMSPAKSESPVAMLIELDALSTGNELISTAPLPPMATSPPVALPKPPKIATSPPLVPVVNMTLPPASEVASPAPINTEPAPPSLLGPARTLISPLDKAPEPPLISVEPPPTP